MSKNKTLLFEIWCFLKVRKKYWLLPMIITFASLLVIGVPITWVLSRLWGTDGVWAGLAGGEVVQAAGIIAYFRTGRWKHKKL